jgi:hypothetical protein
MSRDQNEAHSALVNAILLRLGQRYDVLVKRVVVGTFRRIKGPPQVVTVGVPGEADIQGTVLRVIKEPTLHMLIGQSFAIECKTGDGRLRKEQKDWAEKFESVGGLYLVARQPEDADRLWLKRCD